MKKILIIAGPNGAGKTTFAEEFLPNEADCPEFVNADLIAAGLSPFRPERVAITAGRLMLARLGELAASGKSFAFETTLASRTYLRLIPGWQFSGYRVTLYFLQLPDPEIAVSRVAQRVHFGGHDIPTETVHRRFRRGRKNLPDYQSRVDSWVLYDAAKYPPRLLDHGPQSSSDKLMEDPALYNPINPPPAIEQSLEHAELIGAQAALERASAKAIKRARDAGLEPIIFPPSALPASK